MTPAETTAAPASGLTVRRLCWDLHVRQMMALAPRPRPCTTRTTAARGAPLKPLRA